LFLPFPPYQNYGAVLIQLPQQATPKTDQKSMNPEQTKQPKPTGKRRGKYLATCQNDTVRYPGNNLLYLYFKFKRKRYEYSLETTQESVAQVKADAETKTIKARAQAGTRVTNGRVTLGDLLAHFLKTQDRRVEAHEIKRRTYEAVEDGVKKIRRGQPALLTHEAASCYRILRGLPRRCRMDRSQESLRRQSQWLAPGAGWGEVRTPRADGRFPDQIGQTFCQSWRGGL
jgi:hypothetical protein